MTCKRGTTNRNARGNTRNREARRIYLLITFAADKPTKLGELACRCYRCGSLLTFYTVTVDRIIPGCRGGTYRRNNIRPACGSCNSETGGAQRGKTKDRP